MVEQIEGNLELIKVIWAQELGDIFRVDSGRSIKAERGRDLTGSLNFI